MVQRTVRDDWFTAALEEGGFFVSGSAGVSLHHDIPDGLLSIRAAGHHPAECTGRRIFPLTQAEFGSPRTMTYSASFW
jgi:hypothetical protein